VNMIDHKYVNWLLDDKFKQGIYKDPSYSESEIALLQLYSDIKTRISKGDILQATWKTQKEFVGSNPPSCEGAQICAYKNSIYLFGGFSRNVMGDLRWANFYYL